MVIVTDASGASEPFQVTVLVAAVAVAVPLVALADTSVSCAGSTSVSSAPGLSAWVLGPALVSVTTYVTVPPGVNVPDTVFVAESVEPGGGCSVSVSMAESFSGLASVVPSGAGTVAVVVSEPLAEPAMGQLAG